MSSLAVVGVNWGDEGKGRMVDLLTEECDIVVRCQGGGNAGHTVINERGRFALHLIRVRSFQNDERIVLMRRISANAAYRADALVQSVLTRMPFSSPSPSRAVIIVPVSSRTLLRALSASTSFASPRKLSLRWITVTSLQRSARNSASCRALLPPP